jgi:hypothetical protein
MCLQMARVPLPNFFDVLASAPALADAEFLSCVVPALAFVAISNLLL